MNCKELPDLLREWMHAPPGKRKRLRAALEKSVRSSRMGSQWDDTAEDAFTQWLIVCLRENLQDPITRYRLAEDIAEYLEQKEAIDEPVFVAPCEFSKAASPSPEPVQSPPLPDEEALKSEMRRLLSEIRKKKS